MPSTSAMSSVSVRGDPEGEKTGIGSSEVGGPSAALGGPSGLSWGSGGEEEVALVGVKRSAGSKGCSDIVVATGRAWTRQNAWVGGDCCGLKQRSRRATPCDSACLLWPPPPSVFPRRWSYNMVRVIPKGSEPVNTPREHSIGEITHEYKQIRWECEAEQKPFRALPDLLRGVMRL